MKSKAVEALYHVLYTSTSCIGVVQMVKNPDVSVFYKDVSEL